MPGTGPFKSPEHDPIRIRKLNAEHSRVTALTSRVDILEAKPAPTAATVTFSPAGNVAATNVQAAIEEVDAEKIPLTQKAANNGVATLDSVGRIPFGQIPLVGLTDVYTANSETQMLGLVVETGDVVVRTDTSKSYMKNSSGGAGMAAFTELLTPPDQVLSVDGLTGAVDLTGRYLRLTGGTLSGNLSVTGSITATGQATISGNAWFLSGSASTAANSSNAVLRFGYGGTNNYHHAIVTRHNTALANNAFDFYLHKGGTDLAGAQPTHKAAVLDTSGLTITGTGSFSGNVETASLLAKGNSARFQGDGTAVPAGSAGFGVEIFGYGSEGWVQAYDRTGNAFAPLRLRASAINFDTSGTLRATISSTGLSVTGTVTATGAATFAGNSLSLEGATPGLDIKDTNSLSSTYGRVNFLSSDGTNKGWLGYAASATDHLYVQSGAGDLTLSSASGYDIHFRHAFSTIGRWGSTGLSVTGTVSSTGNMTSGGNFEATGAAHRFKVGALGAYTDVLAIQRTDTGGATVPTFAGIGFLNSAGTRTTILGHAASGNNDFYLQGVTQNLRFVAPATTGIMRFSMGSVEALHLTATEVRPISSTTASAANVYQASSASALLRSTSSRRYKTDIKDLASKEADSIFKLRPITYRSKAKHDDSRKRHWGFIAEEAHEVTPKLVHYDGEGRPDGFQYERVVVGLVDIIKRQEERIAALEAKVGGSNAAQ